MGLNGLLPTIRFAACLVTFSKIYHGYQYAAGTLSFLRSSAIPKLVFSPDDEEIPLDLSDAFLQGLEWLMLAQAQECSWQMAKLSTLKV